MCAVLVCFCLFVVDRYDRFKDRPEATAPSNWRWPITGAGGQESKDQERKENKERQKVAVCEVGYKKESDRQESSQEVQGQHCCGCFEYSVSTAATGMQVVL